MIFFVNLLITLSVFVLFLLTSTVVFANHIQEISISLDSAGVYVDMEEMIQHNQSRSTISDRIQEKSVVDL